MAMKRHILGNQSAENEAVAPYKTILIAGPTASGKSGLALELAKRQRGVIINTDSMQVYRDLRVLTARPSTADEALAPHRCYGCVDAGEVFSTGAWLRMVQQAVPELRQEFETLIFVGGTGLYFNALTLGLSEIPETPQVLRQSLRDELEVTSPAALYAQLQDEDGVSAEQLAPTDGQRILRALEVLRHTGRPLRAWQTDKTSPLINLDLPSTKAIILEPGRDQLRDQIKLRFDAMMDNGALDEVSLMLRRKLDVKMPAMKAIGVAELGAYLSDELTLDQAVNLSVIASRQYAKRQRTWFRGQMDARWNRILTAPEALLLF
jgi:tRNA dimethylallyltransferase